MTSRTRRVADALALFSALAGLASGASTGAWPGGSDSCATPAAIAGQGVFAFDLVAATTGAEGQNEATCALEGNSVIRDDVWFLWTADDDGLATLSTCGLTAVDTKVAVFPGAGCPLDGTSLACGDEQCGTQAVVAWPVVQDEAYLIQVGHSPFGSAGSGDFELEIAPARSTPAAYSAGSAGNPTVAGAPTAQGWTDMDASLGQITVSGLSPDGTTGFNAWQLLEANSTLSGNPRFYERLFDGPERAAARQLGWELDVRARLLPTGFSVALFEFATGQDGTDQLYRVGLSELGADVRAFVGFPTIFYTCPGAMDGEHHTFTLRRPPGPLALDAEFYYDGVLMGPATVAAGDAAAIDGGVRFGKYSSALPSGVNWNEVRFTIGAQAVGTPYCLGDGSATPCPCGNAAQGERGCANSSGAGAQLVASGSESLGADDLLFTCTALLPAQPSLLFVGTNAVNGGAGIPFGDGLRCAGMNVQRLGVRAPDAEGLASWGPGLAAQGGWAPGELRRFQVWYRDPAGGGACGNGFNLSNGQELSFLP